jgi:hypothetical protein
MTAELPHVDVVILSRDLSPLSAEVQRGLDRQQGVRLNVHRVVGAPQAGDANRWQTIARARNTGKRQGSAPWLMFLDDDVELEPGTVPRLVAALRDAPRFAALAADYGDRVAQSPALHVTMGATLFRRSALALFAFRWEPGRCECQCCCDDLRRHLLGIGYCPGVRARHWPRTIGNATEAPQTTSTPEAKPAAGPDRSLSSAEGACILAAFDRLHLGKFRRQFLPSLRGTGNTERVIVVGYGLYPSEQAILRHVPGVELLALPPSGITPPIRRLLDFQTALARLPSDLPVAYWDAGDVLFQGRLEPLWQMVRENPGVLLAVREPIGYPENGAVTCWTMSIADREWRERVFGLMKVSPFLNSGFVAGTAGTLLAYFREAHRMRHGRELSGSTDFGDQMALNIYCHLDPSRWLEVPEGWNYCLYGRNRGETSVEADGRLASNLGTRIHVVHGNASSFRNLDLMGL